MKRKVIITTALCAAMAAMLAACGSAGNKETAAQQTTETATEAVTDGASESDAEETDIETDSEEEIAAEEMYFTDRPVKQFGTVVEVDTEREDIMLFVPFDGITGENGAVEAGPSVPGEQNTEDGQDVIFHTIPGVPFVDAETGLPVGIGEIETGSKVYAWSNGIMTMSIPGQTSLQAMVIGSEEAINNVEYVVAAEVKYNETNKVCEITDQNGGKWTASSATEITPFKTRQMVSLSDIQKGSRMMIWNNASKIVLFN